MIKIRSFFQDIILLIIISIKERLNIEENCYVITDEIENKERNKINIKLNWNIGTEIEKITDNKYRLIINDKESLIMEITSSTKGNISIYYGNVDKPAGWRSLYYGEMTPVNQLVYEVESIREKEILITKIVAGGNVEKSDYTNFSHT
ncbi:MAG: hypothetical protein ACOX15_08005 [Tepidanaerobacteraceae bacterium]